LSAESEGYRESVKGYFEHYGLGVEKDSGIEHLFGTFESQGRKLAGHIYRPGEYKATVVLIHGYLNHSGQMRNLLGFLLSKSFAVAMFDLPGHGLSEGKRGAIEDFSEYSKALCDFTETVKDFCSGPYHLIGFSLGGGIAVEHILINKEKVFDRIVIAAPLIHYKAWKISEVCFKLLGKFGGSIVRVHRKNSSDKEFLKFNKTRDPLHVNKVPVTWVGLLHEWNNRLKQLSGSEKDIMAIQGNKDTTVDWKHNLEFIRERFSNSEVVMIDGARHELFNESADLRDKVFSYIGRYLK